jgi:hypothetical protein
VLQPADSLQLTTDVVLASGVEKVLDGRVGLIVAAENLLGLENPVEKLPVSMRLIILPYLLPMGLCFHHSFQRLMYSNSLVRLVDVVDGQDGEVAVITEVSQGDLLAGLQAKVVDLCLGHVQGDGHGEKDAILETVLLYDSGAQIVSVLCLPF